MIATAAISRLRADRGQGFNHLMMARCSTVERATAVHALYMRLAPDLNPIVVYAELGGTDSLLDQLEHYPNVLNLL